MTAIKSHTMWYDFIGSETKTEFHFFFKLNSRPSVLH